MWSNGVESDGPCCFRISRWPVKASGPMMTVAQAWPQNLQATLQGATSVLVRTTPFRTDPNFCCRFAPKRPWQGRYLCAIPRM